MKREFELDKSISALTQEYTDLKNLVGEESLLEEFIPGYQGSLTRLRKTIKALVRIKKGYIVE